LCIIIQRQKNGKKLKDIKNLVLENLNEMGISSKKVILPGSRARGDSNRYSDYDILIITENIRDSLVKIQIPSDIIIKSEKEVKYYRDKIGSIVREALREGIVI
jgi:predicted nucleotidyltransferase